VAITEEAPVVLNAGRVGLLPSRYASGGTKALAITSMNDAAERAALLSDGFWACCCQVRSARPSSFSRLAPVSATSNEPTPWGTLASAVAFIDRALPKEQLPVLPPRFARSSNRSIGASGGRHDGRERAHAQLRALVLSSARYDRAPMRRSRPKR